MYRTFGIKIVALSFEAIEIVGLVADLELEIVDMLEVVLPQPLALLRRRRFGRARLARRRWVRSIRFDCCCRHCRSERNPRILGKEESGFLFKN